MSASWKTKPKNLVTNASAAVGDAVKVMRQKYDQSGLKSGLDQATDQVQQVLEETGLTQYAMDASQTVGDHFDTISGAKLLALVEERLEIQSRFNNILATKLEEALKRIAELELALKSQK